MIIENLPTKIHQSRDVRPKYANPTDPNYSSNQWGKPVDMIVSKTVELSLNLDICYDNEHEDLVHNLIRAVKAIVAVTNESDHSPT